MKIANIILELEKFCNDNKKEEKSIFKTKQKEFFDGYIGVMLNECINSNLYETYIYIKNNDSIACPLLLKKNKDVIEATNYYDELVNLIENNTPEYIIERCKIGI
jgi:hypothetical protein